MHMDTSKLRGELERLIANTCGTLGLCVQYGDQSPLIRHNAELRFPSASLIKLPIYYEYQRQCQQGRLDANSRISLEKRHWVDGSGIMKDAEPGSLFSLDEIARLMLTHSDNVATNLMIERVGLEGISRAISDLGMKGTALQRKMYDFEARDRGLDNWTTPGDVQGFLLRMLNPGRDEEEIVRATINTLKAQTVNHKLAGKLPKDVVMAHKTGELDRVQHNAGIIYAAGSTCCVTVMSMDLADNAAGVEFCQEVGRLVYRAMV
jgi:beta-lactamase class A